MEKLTPEQIGYFVTLEDQYENRKPIDILLFKKLNGFGKDLREVITNVRRVIDSNDEYSDAYQQLQGTIIPGLVAFAQTENTSKLFTDQASLNFAAVRPKFRKARQTFINDHLGQTSDSYILEELQTYVYGKAAAVIHQKDDFQEKPELEELIKGCQICKDYFELSKKHIQGILHMKEL